MRLSLLAVLVSILVAGCGPSEEPAAKLVPENRQTVEPPAGAVDELPSNNVDADVTLEVADEARLAEIIASNRGKVVLVDYWALW